MPQAYITEHTDNNVSTLINADGQIFLDKAYAGQQVVIEPQEAGVWLVRLTDVMPHDELWIHESEHKEKLKMALDWAITHKTRTDNTDAILTCLGEDNPNV